MDVHLLMWRASGEPEAPIRLDAATGEPLPPTRPPPIYLTNIGAEANDLKKQRWGLVVPEGPQGERLKSLLEPLRRFRGNEQGEEAEVFTVPPRMSAVEAMDYRDRHLQPASRSARANPRFLLFAGAPDVVPPELLEVVADDGTGFAGRIAFQTDAGYEAYVAKVLERERRPLAVRSAPAILVSVADGSPATRIGRDHLMEPLARKCHEHARTGHFPTSPVADEVLRAGSADRLLELAATRGPVVLFTMSHGLGPPCDGWRSAEEQRRRQGSLFLSGDQVLEAESVRGRPFVPGGIWFYFACYGAGTPLQSLYQPWLKHMGASVDGIARSRPLDGRPFVGSLAQAALENPEGPVAVIAHQDAAWTHAFVDAKGGRSHVERFVDALSGLMEGWRAGVALQALRRFTHQVDGKIRRLSQSGLDPVTRALLFMERHDLSSYVVLGDPAACIAMEGERRG